MIKCETCKKVTKPGESTSETVKEKREVEYNHAILIGRLPHGHETTTLHLNNKDLINKYVDLGFKVVKRFVRKGWEIKKTIRVCSDCDKENK